ncbi:GSCOCG00012146001-RA-CDS, partial [Cotesia congregata]
QLLIDLTWNDPNIKVLSRKPVEALVSDMLNPSKIDSASTRYGLKMETHAKDKYQELTNCIVKRVGVLVSKFQPWLCASLDGVVTDDGSISKIVEFKCPSSCEKKPIINTVDNSSNIKYLQLIDNKLQLKKTDLYYTQVQVQMYVSGMSVCDFFVYSPVEDGSFLIEVHRDEDFLKTVILKSEQFYFQHYLPALYA